MIGVSSCIHQEVFIVQRQPNRERVRMTMRRRTAEPQRAKIHQKARLPVVRTHASEPGIREQLSW